MMRLLGSLTDGLGAPLRDSWLPLVQDQRRYFVIRCRFCSSIMKCELSQNSIPIPNPIPNRLIWHVYNFAMDNAEVLPCVYCQFCSYAKSAEWIGLARFSQIDWAKVEVLCEDPFEDVVNVQDVSRFLIDSRAAKV